MDDRNQNQAQGAEQALKKEWTGAQIGQMQANAPMPIFTIRATDLGAPELVLEYMKKNFHSLNDATLFQTLGVAIEMRNYRFR